jgi:DNA-binding GntR family transcriptional regulator
MIPMIPNSLKEKAYHQIRQDIISNLLAAGQALNEKVLAANLKISKTPVREAIQLLHQEGFVQIIPNKGAIVTPVTISDLREIMQMREALEPFAAGMAALNHNTEILSEFEQRFVEHAGKSPSDYEGMRECGTRFHQFIVECTRNQRLKDSVINLTGQMDRIRTIFCPLLPNAYLRTTLDEHIGVVEAIKLGDYSKAEKVMRVHIRNYWEILKQMV